MATPDTNVSWGRELLRGGRRPGRGREYYRRGGRGYDYDTRKRKEKTTSTSSTKFTGATKDMNGQVFQGFGETSLINSNVVILGH